jgi:hypothetical protein
MKSQALVLLAALCCAVSLIGPAASQTHTSPRSADRPVNLGLAMRFGLMLVDGPTAVFDVDEASQGRRDLNGDGEVAGSVLHVFDALSGEVRNLGLENGSAQSFANGRLLVITSFPTEADDADGSFGWILHAYDTARRRLTNLRLRPAFNDEGGLLFDGRRVAIGVDEGFQARDLNQDGDRFDTVLHLFDSVTGRVQNTGLAVSFIGKSTVASAGRWFAVAVPESRDFATPGQSRDLNGDGDTTDVVTHLFDTATGRVTNLGVAGSFADFRSGFQSGIGEGLVAVSEAAQGADLNADRDLSDTLLHSVDLSSGRVRNTGIGIVRSGTEFFPLVQDLTVQDGFAIFNRQESDAREDLNGDGDQNDVALQVLNTRSGRLRSLKVQAAMLPAEAQPGRALLLMDETVIRKDLNGDGDVASDMVLGLADVSGEEPLVVSTRRALASASNGDDVFTSWPPFPTDAFPLQLRDGRVTFVVSEAAEAGRDLNGDGDTNDFLLHIADLATLTTVNTRLSGSFAYRTVQAPLLPVTDSRVVLPVREDRQGTDFNFDGDMQDMVLQLVDVRSGRSRNTGFAVATVPLSTMPVPQPYSTPVELPLLIRGNGIQSALVEETGVDLNADGDTRDLVLQLFDVATGKITNTGFSPGMPDEQFLNSTALAFAAFSPGLSLATPFSALQPGPPSDEGPGIGDAYAFIVSEAAQGNVDLNGDGDTDDLIVHATRLSDRDRDGRLDFAQ